ncbi:MAG TPA: radical SAM protein [Candidatus Polarisedimenticolaceae bacterium]|nr:radical SAM protein [Candidatus Polarisedimenticolaceae bacterium]
MNAQLPLITRFASSWLQRSWPSYCVIFVTSRCNARCVFCFNWENVFSKPKDPEITLAEFEALSRSMKPLLQLVLSGGEPFLRRDLGEIISAFYRNSGTRLVGIPTNAYLPDAIEETTRQVLTECPELTLNLNLSIDGILGKHDAVRGVKGQFRKILDSYARLDALRRRFPNLTINAQSVISKYNVEDIEKTIRQLRDELELGFHAVGPVRGSTPEKDAKEITSEQVRAIYTRTDKIRHEHNDGRLMSRIADSLLHRLREIELRAMDSKRREFVCLAGRKMVVISHDAKVYPCEPLWLDDEQKRVFPQDGVMGDLRQTGFDIRPILASERAESVRADVDKKLCACMYGCAIYNSLLFAPSTYPATLKELILPSRQR